MALVGKVVRFTVGTTTLDATTDALGIAKVSTSLGAGSSVVGAAFAGDPGATAATATTTVAVGRTDTRVRFTSGGLVSSTGSLTAILTDAAGAPLGGRTLSFAVGATTTTASTGASGTASVSKDGADTGPTSATVTFAGDACHVGSSDAAALLVYASSGFSVWGGDTVKPVVGDLLNFWGHSWAKENVHQGDYNAANEFKGFAQSVSVPGLCQPTARTTGTPALVPGCWSSKGGESWPPPPPLPTYLQVRVPDSIAKSKGDVYGNVAGTVVLRVSPTPVYDQVPGKPGWGTVVAVTDAGAIFAPAAAITATQTQPTTALPGATFDVALVLANPGASTAKAVTVAETFLGMSPPSASATVGDLSGSTSATRVFSVSVPSVPARGTTETQQEYLARLAAATGRPLRASGRVRFSDATGSLPPPVDVGSFTTQVVPEIAVGLDAPACDPTTGATTYSVTAYNYGLAPAAGVKASITLPDASVQELDFGTVGAASSALRSVTVTGGAGATVPSVRITWADAGGNAYGPLVESAATGTSPGTPKITTTLAPLGAFLPSTTVPLVFSLSNVGTATAVGVKVSSGGAIASVASLAAGGSATVALSTVAPPIAGKGPTELDADYLARLLGVSGSTFSAPHATTWADLCEGLFGPILGTASGAVVVPVLPLTMTGPDAADAGDTVTYTLAVTNTGGASAEAPAALVALPTGGGLTAPFASVAVGATAAKTFSFTLPTLGPRGATETATAYLDRLQAFAKARSEASAAISWSDLAANVYGPVGGKASTAARLPIVVSTATAPATTLPAQSVPLTFTLQNNGSAAAADAKVTLIGSGAATSPAAIAVGATATGNLSTPAPTVAAKGATESDADYLARLGAASGPFGVRYTTAWSDKNATAYGPIEAQVGTKVVLPRVEIAIAGPAAAKAGDPLTFTVTLKNTGSANAASFATAVTFADGTTATPTFTGTAIAPGATTTASVTWTVPSTVAAGLATTSAGVTWQDSAGQPYGSVGAIAKTTVATPNACPTVTAGPDRSVTLPATAALTGVVTDDGLPAGAAVTQSWVQVSGPGVASFADATAASTTVSFSEPGSYVLKLVATDTQCVGTGSLTVTVVSRSKTYPAGSPVAGETSVNLLRDGGELTLDGKTKPFRFLWVAASGRNTLLKFDTDTGKILGEYASAPTGQPANPSRTTVEKNGGVWAANRGGDPGSYWLFAIGGNSVVHVGLEENGECVDRNGNGVIDTSHGFGDVKAWTNAGGADTTGGVSTAQDECVLHYVRVAAYGTRHVTVDRNNDVWVGGSYSTNSGAFDLIDGKTGLIKRSEAGVGYGGYGGLMDPSGVIWSARPLLRWDPAKPLAGPSGGNWKGYAHSSYGLCVDPSGNVWNTSDTPSEGIRKFAPNGDLLATYTVDENYLQGCAADANGDIWIANHIFAASPAVVHLKNDGTKVGRIPTVGPVSGVSVDGAGKVWATAYYAGKVQRIDPKLGALGPDGVTHVGAVDFTSGDGGTPSFLGQLYDYSDMTGSTLVGAPPAGTWTFVHDSGIPDAKWGKMTWTAMVPGDGSLDFRVSSSTDGVTFGPQVKVTSATKFSVADGRYLKVSVGFKRSKKGESPRLYDLTLGTDDWTPSVSNKGPTVNAGPNLTDSYSPTRLTASAWDDGRDTGGPMTFSWSKVSGPGSVVFSPSDNEATDVSVSTPGTYVLRFTASDGVLSASSDMTLTAIVANKPPVVSIGGAPPYTGTTTAPVALTATVTDDGLPTSGTLTQKWSKVSGLGMVTFTDDTAATTTASFSADGAYVLRLSATDGELGAAKDVVVFVGIAPTSTNTAPIVDAGPRQKLTLPAKTITLTGMAADDGLPLGAGLNYTWMQVGIIPATVTFSSTTSLVTTVTFPKAGLYAFRLWASDTALADYSDTVVEVFDDLSNTAPTVSLASLVLTGSVGDTLSLGGAVTDDGKPNPPNLVTTYWLPVSGPAVPTIAAPSLPSTSATFPAAGDYGLRLVATDGALDGTAVLTVKIAAVAPTNKAPIVTATAPATAAIPGFVTLAGSVVDDGLPASGLLTSNWSMVSGPGTVSFGSGTSPTSTATFSTPGTYVLRLTASDGALSTSADLTVTAGGTNVAPVVSAGSAIALAHPTKSAVLAGSVTDDGLPSGAAVTSLWSVVSGPGAPAFGSASSPTSSVTFPLPGTYVLRLTASDTALSASAEVTVTVGAPSGALPVVAITSPVDGSQVTKPRQVIGSVSAGDWILEMTVGDLDGATDPGSWQKIGSGTAAVSGDVLGNVDPTRMLNGVYSLRLTSTTTAGSASAVSSMVVDKQMKVGVMALAFDDLTIPTPGFALQVQRQYDSRDKRVGDFGVGWRLGVRNVRIEKSRSLGKQWFESRDDSGFFPQYCLAASRPGQVAVTLPSGKVYRFDAKPATDCQTLYPFDAVDVGFRPMTGTVGSLVAAGASSVRVQALVTVPGAVEIQDLSFGVWNPTQFTMTDEEGIQYTIDQKEGVQKIRDLDGNELTISATGLTHSNGKSVAFTRDGLGRITKATDPDGKAILYAYDAAGNLATSTNREAEVTTYGYDGDHDLTSVKDPRGVTPATYGYDASGRLTGSTDAFSASTTFTHDLTGKKETVTDALGNTTVFEYDDDGNVVKKTDALGKVWLSTYDANDNKLSESNPLGHTRSWTYDASFNVLTETDGLGRITSYTYGPNRRMKTRTDAIGRTTTDAWDFFHAHRLSHLDPTGATTSFFYNAKGWLETTTDPRGGVSTNLYSIEGLVMGEKDPLGNVVSYTYDASFRRTSETRKRTKSDGALETLVTSYVLDGEGRVVKTILPDGSSTTSVLDKLGKPVETTDALGRVTKHTYDALGRLTKTTFPDATTEETTYDLLGRRKTTTDRAGRVTTYGYDAVGRLALTTYPDGKTRAQGYDAAGRLVSETNENGHTTTYGYDAADRRITVTDAAGATTTMAYDDAGQLSSVTDALGHGVTYSHDLAGRQTKVTYADGTVEETAYDASGNRTSKKDQAGVVTSYTYDLLNRLTKVTDALGGVTTYGYDELGHKVLQTDANLQATKYGYDALGRRITRTLPLGQVETMGYDAVGNLTSKRDFNGKTTTFAYDLNHRLVSRTPDSSFVGESATSWTYTA
ncbi:MAG: PKD domain-containing protein, partial [Myxococcales bacterium]|nr:PKD domain-containing protein [Myxococcales bacterium]